MAMAIKCLNIGMVMGLTDTLIHRRTEPRIFKDCPMLTSLFAKIVLVHLVPQSRSECTSSPIASEAGGLGQARLVPVTPCSEATEKSPRHRPMSPILSLCCHNDWIKCVLAFPDFGMKSTY